MSDINIKQGATFRRTYRWGAPPYNYVQPVSLVATVPVTITAADHGVPDGWPVALESGTSCTCSEYRPATVIDDDTLEFNQWVSPELDVTDAYIKYLTPVNLTDYSAELQIRTSARAADPLLTLSTSNGGIELSVVDNSIEVVITAAQTAALSFQSAVFQLELTNDITGDVTRLDEGVATLSREVVRA